ncbi:AGAP013463-PA-like protein [Anopheles sinensis]|uniref:AGAP013463-PA-like protein n=1 Tax=Anopheles sinensis TaxID=74873 RepID=A0A084VNH2_ANOSI|nr:AGAP013463-PA-like protein [Anopheles sinensis]
MDLRGEGSDYTIFELACQTCGKHEFIEACIKAAGPESNIVLKANPTTQEYPIHLAVKSLDEKNLTALLSSSPQMRSQLVTQQYDGKTALFCLFELLSRANEHSGFQCMKVLLENGADINTTNQHGVTAMEVLLEGNESWRKSFLEYCLYSGKVELNMSLSEKIKNTFPTIPLPHTDGTRFAILSLEMDYMTEEDFIARFENEARKGEISLGEIKSLLTEAIQFGKLKVVQKLLEKEMNPSERLEILSDSLNKCCKHGNVPILEWLLQNIPKDAIELVNKQSLLTSLTQQINVNADNMDCRFFKCMQKLLEDSRVDVNKTDFDRLTALHYAVKYGLNHVQELLLEKGAYLGGEDLFDRALICNMNPVLLERHLNRCVSDNGSSPDHKDYSIRLNFHNFQSPTHADEMSPIVQLAQLPESRRLLKHPVIASIVLVKWLRMSMIFYFNLVLFSLFFFSFSACIYYTSFKWWSLGVAVLGLVYMTLREVVQCALHPRQYIKSVENYIEVMLIVSSVIALSLHYTTGFDDIRNVAEVFSIMLSAVEFTVLLATIPRLSFCTQMVMLKTVATNFIRCLALYSPILIGFGISFFMLYRDQGTPVSDSGPNNATETGEVNPFNEFTKIRLALLKTVVMMAGELEASNLRLNQSWICYGLFLLFLFFVPIVLSNLLNGLAVNDIMTIQMESELFAIRQKAFVINRSERMLCGLREMWLRFFGGKPHKTMEKYILIQPNRGNKILVPKKATNLRVTVEDATRPEQTLSAMVKTMDPMIVTAARDILCSNKKDEMHSDLQLRQIIHHLLQEIAEMNILLTTRFEHIPPHSSHLPSSFAPSSNRPY